MVTTTAGFSAGDQSLNIDDLIGSDADNILARKYVLLAGAACVRGQVMGVITTGGKVIGSLSGASDGSQTPFGIAAEDVAADVSSPVEDKAVNVYVRGSFNEHALTLGASHTIASIREGLRDKGIYLETPVKRYP
jgi:Bacteriophage lambda head decoration protein D